MLHWRRLSYWPEEECIHPGRLVRPPLYRWSRPRPVGSQLRMVDLSVPTAIEPLDVRRDRPHHLVQTGQSRAPAASDRLEPARNAGRPAALQHLRRDAEIDG